jgi:hypothetical protein
LSLQQIILKSREQDNVFGFDDTYLDLARALRQQTTKGKNYAEFAASRSRLEKLLGGVVEYDQASGRWQFVTGRQRFPIGVTAEGIKKIAILDTLLGNRYLDPSSIVIIDEPESALHPTAISEHELPASFKVLDLAKADFRLVLVIKGDPSPWPEAWLPPIKDELALRLQPLVNTWRLSPTAVMVFNEALAKQYGLILGQPSASTPAQG